MTVTVLIPLYNKRAYVGRALDSVLAQTVPAQEVLVVDDSSSDGGADWVRQSYPSVTVLTKPNGGPASARNFGLRRASGELVALLDADDLWRPDHLERLLAAARAFPQAACYVSGVQALGSRTPSCGYQHCNTNPDPHPIEYLQLLSQGIHSLSSSSVLLRREIFQTIGYYEESIRQGEDVDLWFRLSFRAPVVFVPGATCYYDQSIPGSLSQDAPIMPTPARLSGRLEDLSHFHRALAGHLRSPDVSERHKAWMRAYLDLFLLRAAKQRILWGEAELARYYLRLRSRFEGQARLLLLISYLPRPVQRLGVALFRLAKRARG